MEKFNNIEQAILRAIVYFDIFKFPLTTHECWRFLYDPQKQLPQVNIEQVEIILNSLEKKNILKQNFGFWQLSEMENYYYRRQERYRIFISKWQRARRWVRLFTFLNSVRFVAIVNSLGYHNPELNDDIDLLIITRSRQVWLTRWWLTGFAKLLGLRPTIKHQANGLCLSFYLSDEALTLKPLMINHDDVYLHFWLPGITVLFDDGVAKTLLKQNQEWLRCFPNLNLSFDSQWASKGIVNMLRFLSRFLTLSIWEKLSKKVQLRLLPNNLAQAANKDTSVIISDQVLKFHNPDRREYYYRQWQIKLGKLGI